MFHFQNVEMKIYKLLLGVRGLPFPLAQLGAK